MGVAPQTPTPVTHVGNLCLGSPCFKLCVPRGPGSRCEHTCMCDVCVHTCMRVCFHGSHGKDPIELNPAVACSSGPCASSGTGTERSDHASSGERAQSLRGAGVLLCVGDGRWGRTWRWGKGSVWHKWQPWLDKGLGTRASDSSGWESGLTTG